MKKSYLVIIMLLFLIGCSQEEDTSEYENLLEEKQNEIEHYKAELEVLKESLEEFKQNPSANVDDVPQLWSDPDIQLWKYVSDYSLDEINGWKQGTTKWRKWDRNNDIDRRLFYPNDIWQTPGELLSVLIMEAELSSSLGTEVWDITTRIEFVNETNAIGYILSYGFMDDSVAGSDVKLTMKETNGYWYIETIEVQENCYRGVSEESNRCL